MRKSPGCLENFDQHLPGKGTGQSTFHSEEDSAIVINLPYIGLDQQKWFPVREGFLRQMRRKSKSLASGLGPLEAQNRSSI